MKVLYILSSSSTFGGSTKSFLRTCMTIKEKDLDIHVVCPDKGPAYNTLKQAGIKTFIIPTRFNIYPQFNSLRNILEFPLKLIKHWFINWIAYHKVCKLCERYHYDIIHTNVSVINVGEKVARKYGIAHIYHIREYQDKDFGMKMIPTRTSFIDTLKKGHSICITKDIQKHFGLSNCNSKVIYDGIKSVKNIIYNPLKENYLLFVGRVDTNKGFDTVIKAFADYRKEGEGLKLYVAGMFISKDFENWVYQFISRNDLTESVVFLGLRNDVDQLMQKAKACIIASPFEGFGLVMVEAMFNGCLTLAYNACGTKEQLENAKELGYQNIALTFSNIAELSQLMTNVSTNNISYYKETIDGSQKVVSSLYTIEQNVNQIYSYYKKILSK